MHLRSVLVEFLSTVTDYSLLYKCFYFQTGTCALFFAAQGGYLDICQQLISHGAPVDLPSYVSISTPGQTLPLKR